MTMDAGVRMSFRGTTFAMNFDLGRVRRNGRDFAAKLSVLHVLQHALRSRLLVSLGAGPAAS